MEMQPIEIPEIIVLRGEEAIEALHGFINELEGQRGKDLTDKQTDALVRLAEGLTSSIEAEMRSNASEEEMRLVKQLKKTTMKCISRSARVFDAYTRFARVMFKGKGFQQQCEETLRKVLGKVSLSFPFDRRK